MSKKGALSSFLKSKKPAEEQRPEVKEVDLKAKSPADITPDDVLGLRRACDEFLCKTTDNVYHIDFVSFKLRDLDRDIVLFEVAKPPDMPYEPPSEDDTDDGRFVRYDFTSDFLRLKNVGATVGFRIGDKPVNNFRMIERHYFKDRVLKTFDFDFPFCIPNSSNTCEHLYEFPKMSEAEIMEMVQAPYETRSDSFYFVDNQLVMHNRADYSYKGTS
eukprot:m.481273 g.481273  ORF g.481273 m.481273 type:complete len:216 (+) comp22113_c0_seq1:270-917(+)